MSKIIASVVMDGIGSEYVEPTKQAIKNHMEYKYPNMEYITTEPYQFDGDKYRIDAVEVGNSTLPLNS